MEEPRFTPAGRALSSGPSVHVTAVMIVRWRARSSPKPSLGGEHKVDASLFPLKDLPAAWPWFERLGTGRARLSPGPNPKPQPGPKTSTPTRKGQSVLAGRDVGARKVSQPAHRSAHPSQCHMSQRSKETAAGADPWLPNAAPCDGASVSPSAQWASQAHRPGSFETWSVPTALHSHRRLSFLPGARLPLTKERRPRPQEWKGPCAGR